MSVFMTNTSPERSSAEGPLISALMLGQDNKSAAADKAISDTLNTGNFALGPALGESDVDEAIDIGSSSIRGVSGSFDKENDHSVSLNEIQRSEDTIMEAIPDVLEMKTQLLELHSPEAITEAIPDVLEMKTQLLELHSIRDAITEAIPDILEMKTQLLELHSPEAITEAIPDVLEMKTQLLELHSNRDAITEAIPDMLEMKTQLLELHSPGNTITNGIPVILKLNSQAQAAQITALLQGQSIPVAISTKNTFEKNTPKPSNGAPIIGSIMQSGKRVTVDESKKGSLSDEQLQFWKENGYLVIPNALPSEQKDLLLKTVHESAEALAGGGERVEKHSYLPGQKSYVHPCGRAIATLSDYAFNPAIEPLKRIQRIGCGIHRVMPPFRKTILSPFHSVLAKSLGYKDPRIIQSLIIVKAGEIGARVVPHQDGCSGFTNPSSCTTFWYALEDCSVENGCLAVAPGSHRVQPITRRCKNVDGKPEFVDLERPVYAEIEGLRDESLPRRNEDGEFVYEKLEVKAGTLILMHGNLMHTSEANRSSKSRVAFNFGVVEGELEWLEDNYLQPYEGETEFEKL